MKKVEKILKEFGEAMRKARQTYGLKQGQMGGILGCPANSISAWELGRTFPSKRMWPAILKELGVNVQMYVQRIDNIPDEGFGRVLFDIRSEMCLTRTEFAKRALGAVKHDLQAWEEGKSLPSLRLLNRMEERLNNAPRIEELRPAWEEALQKLDPVEQAYKRGEKPPKQQEAPKEEPKEEPKEKPKEEEVPVVVPSVQVSPRQAMQAALAAKPVPAQASPAPKVVAPIAASQTGSIKVSLSRVINRAEAAGYPVCGWKGLPDLLYRFAEVIVAEAFNARERRSSLEIPWPLPLEPGSDRCAYVCKVDGVLVPFTDILDFNYAGYLREHGLTPVIVMTDLEETQGFFIG